MPVGILGVMGSSFLVGLSGALVPGPLTTLALEQSSRFGAMAGVSVAFGHALLELLLVLALALGLGGLLASPAVAGTVGLVGGMVLVWMGWTTVRNAGLLGEKAVVLPALSERRDGMEAAVVAGGVAREGYDAAAAAGKLPVAAAVARALAGGVVVTFANPYCFIWWATIGTTYMGLLAGTGWASLAAFYVGHIAADISWVALLVVIVARGVRHLGGKAYRAVLTTLGVFLIGLAGFCLYSAGKLVLHTVLSTH